MKGYQKERASVNGSIEVMGMEPLVELASEGRRGIEFDLVAYSGGLERKNGKHLNTRTERLEHSAARRIAQ
jgi:hypothetical protein